MDLEMCMEGTTDDLEDGGSGGEVCGGGGRGGASSASGHQGSVPRGDPKERSPWGRGGEGRGGREASVSPSTSGTGRYLTRIWWQGGGIIFQILEN